MNHRIWMIALVASPALGACSSDLRPQSALASAVMQSPSGAAIGTAALLSGRGSQIIDVSVSGLTPGEHGLHLHAVGSCSPPDFTSAGSHLNPAGAAHGFRNPAGHHLGDLPNLVADATGRASIRATLPPLTESALMAALFDQDGTAIVIHAAPDDFVTDPSGNSGARVACGALVRP